MGTPFEDVVDNPYLDDFTIKWNDGHLIYRFILNSRFRQVMQIRESGKKIIQDRTIYEDAHIFVLIFTQWA
jgi:deoxyadenosine/deoxycytidine kinase